MYIAMYVCICTYRCMYIPMCIHMCIYLSVYACMYICTSRRSPMDITLCGQISNNPKNTIQPINDAKVEVYFNIAGINVS